MSDEECDVRFARCRLDTTAESDHSPVQNLATPETNRSDTDATVQVVRTIGDRLVTVSRRGCRCRCRCGDGWELGGPSDTVREDCNDI